MQDRAKNHYISVFKDLSAFIDSPIRLFSVKDLPCLTLRVTDPDFN